MTARELMARNQRKANTIVFLGFALFVGCAWLAQLNVLPMAPLMVMLPGAILFEVSVHSVRLFNLRCLQCGAAWESMVVNERNFRYCPACGYDLNIVIDQEPEKMQTTADRLFLKHHQSASTKREEIDGSLPRLWRGKILVPFLILAVTGLILSLIVHIYGSLGLAQPFGEIAWTLHVGIFVVMIPEISVERFLRRGFRQQSHSSWAVLLRGCPTWMRILTSGLGVYAITNFITFLLAAARLPPGLGGAPPPIVFRGFSGHWMVFYSSAAAVLYSAWVVGRCDPARIVQTIIGFCPLPHTVNCVALALLTMMYRNVHLQMKDKLRLMGSGIVSVKEIAPVAVFPWRPVVPQDSVRPSAS
jgi:hypothetical protein